MDLEQAISQIRNILAETGAPETSELPDQVRWLVAENARLRPLADAGNQYRADLTESALAQGVRALGEKFNMEAYRGLLTASSIEVIKQFRADWEIVGNARFQAGTAVNETERKNGRRQVVPDAAYKS